MAFEAERREVAYFMRRLYAQRLTTATGGNVSRRAADGSVLLTPSATDKARIRADEIAVFDPAGRNLTPGLVPSSESPMHLRIYKLHPRVSAVVHAHPITASAFACAQTPIDLELISETYALLDAPVMVPYACSGTDALAESVAECAERTSSILLQNHGALTTGETLMQAFSRMELLEEAARLTLLVKQLEGVRHLTSDERAGLDRLMGR